LWFNENFLDKKVSIFFDVFKNIKGVDAYFCLGWTNENVPWKPLVDRKFLLYIVVKIWTKKIMKLIIIISSQSDPPLSRFKTSIEL
jgi:hypothetical protein